MLALTDFATKLHAELLAAGSVRIATHVNPDGDALGCSLALLHAVRAMGVRAELLCNNPAPLNLVFLPGSNEIRFEPVETPPDLGLVVDLNVLHRLGKVAPWMEECRQMAVIDHHEPGEGLGDFSYVNAREAACAMMVFDVLKQWKVEITPVMATCLLTGIVTDTGSFRFPNTSERSMHLAAELIGLGADISKIGEEVYQKRDLAAVKLESAMLDRMKLEVNGRLCWSYLTHEDFQASGGSDEHTEGLVNDLLSINTVGVAVLFREPKQGKIRCSLRSRREYDVASIAQGFGGGGHRNAAGCTFEEDMTSATDKLIGTLRKCLES